MDTEKNSTIVQSSCGFIPYLQCLILATFYVSSLYVWRISESRTHPSVMKRRFISVTFVTLVAPFYVYCLMDQTLLSEHSFLKILGFRLGGLYPAIILPLVLTFILFLGPVSILYFNGFFPLYAEIENWFESMSDLIWLRNYVFAPISEEITFRACMLAMILHCMEPKTAMFMCPIFFGTAHLHHIMEQLREGHALPKVLLMGAFQFGFTSIFGAYSAYLFLRTGHIIAPILVHAFCNHMGAPDIGAIFELPPRQRLVSTICYIGGLIAWLLLVRPLTEPYLYSNDLPWADKIHSD